MGAPDGEGEGEERLSDDAERVELGVGRAWRARVEPRPHTRVDLRPDAPQQRELRAQRREPRALRGGRAGRAGPGGGERQHLVEGAVGGDAGDFVAERGVAVLSGEEREPVHLREGRGVSD